LGLAPYRRIPPTTRQTQTAIGSISILAESGGGLYWVVAGILGAIFGGVANARVLLVEILR
jgi:hypothetical protein